MAQPARQYDVGILGGGAAGCATAIALARRGLRVALVRRRSRIPLTLAEVLPPCARPLLEELGVWPALAETSPTQVRGVVARWGADDSTGRGRYESTLDGGWHIVRRRFDDLLERVAVELGVEVHGAALSVSQKRDKWNVPTKSASRITQIGANFLVDATGRNAWLATRLGIGRTRINDQICLATVENAGEPADAPDQRLLLEVVDEGWWYSACLPGGRRTWAFMTDQDLLPASPRRWPLELGRLLGQTTLMRPLVEARRVAKTCHVLPADTSACAQVVGRQWLAVGEAAVAWDPLAGLGCYQALESGRRAATALAESFDRGPEPLVAYQHWMAAHWQACLKAYREHYQTVGRRLQTPFWSRRAALRPTPQAIGNSDLESENGAGLPLADA